MSLIGKKLFISNEILENNSKNENILRISFKNRVILEKQDIYQTNKIIENIIK